MEANIHNTNSIVLGKIKKVDGTNGIFYTRNITVCKESDQDDSSERVLNLTMFADKKSALKVEVSSIERI